MQHLELELLCLESPEVEVGETCHVLICANPALSLLMHV